MGRLFPVEAARKRAHRLIPAGDHVTERIEICIDVEELRVDIQSEMNEAIEGQDVGKQIERYAIKNTGIPIVNHLRRSSQTLSNMKQMLLDSWRLTRTPSNGSRTVLVSSGEQ